VEWVKIFNNRQEALSALADHKPRLLVVNGKRICLLARNDVMYAMEEHCPHNGESLVKGNVNYLGELICPWHGYRFNVITGREGDERCRDLITFPVKDTADGIFIHL
jgi:Ferredoxin subunits of nitrite reductase and ring-hydroxylating dioxygenases